MGRKLNAITVTKSREGGTYTDGSRYNNETAAPTVTRAEYLERYATVMDVELLGVAMWSEIGDLVITDSQGASGRIQNMQFEGPRGWVEQKVEAAAKHSGEKIAWVKGHSGVVGNELADLRAKREVWIGSRRGDPGVATVSGIKHEFRVTWKSKQVQEWDREAVKGHTYICTDRGSLQSLVTQDRESGINDVQVWGSRPERGSHHEVPNGWGGVTSADNEEFCRAVYKLLWEEAASREGGRTPQGLR